VITDFTDVAYEGNMCTAILSITVYDADLAQTDGLWGITARYPVAAADQQDKAPYKAMTQGEKYAWQKMFKVPTQAIEDADTDEDTPDSTPQTAKTSNGKISPQKAATLRAAAAQAVDDKKLDNKAVQAFLTATFGKARVTELTAGEGADFEKWLTEKIGG
jgi:hypothetical protein